MKRKKKCIVDMCTIIPSYNYRGEKKRLYCKNHKLEGMINISNTLCLNCNKTASYNYEDEGIPLYCKQHKMFMMINVKIKPKCLYVGCKKLPICGYEGNEAVYCLSHKLKGMVADYKKMEATLLKLEIIDNDPHLNELFSMTFFQ